MSRWVAAAIVLLVMAPAGLLGQSASPTYGTTYLAWDTTERTVFVQSALQIYIFGALEGCQVPQGTACQAVARLQCFHQEDPLGLSMRFASHLRDRPELWSTNLGLVFSRWAHGYCSR